ncbi:Nudix family hydrolase [Litoribrevibacter euphylliae]|uniref:8-oxo-dGTP diphosphatase n=1 Tax=Litoribrevibacter euphylliae TaxID=1834034 RepID=A0ABV7HI24_9GAMM
MKVVHVAVAVIERENGDICIAKRADHQHQGGLWEFPGGKVEAGETITQALQREIHEELGIDVLAHSPLISVRYRYTDKHVLLDVHRIHQFEGEPHGKEGQPVVWCPKSQLKNYEFPAANKGILNALILPKQVAILDPISNEQVEYLTQSYAPDELVIYVRDENKSEFLTQLSDLKDKGYPVLQKNDPLMAHLTSAQLNSLEDRPDVIWLSASCHNEAEIEKANALEVDFIFISPVQVTPSHPGGDVLGWDKFQELAELAHMPAYALGGVDMQDMEHALALGAQGIAGIRAFKAE